MDLWPATGVVDWETGSRPWTSRADRTAPRVRRAVEFDRLRLRTGRGVQVARACRDPVPAKASRAAGGATRHLHRRGLLTAPFRLSTKSCLVFLTALHLGVARPDNGRPAASRVTRSARSRSIEASRLSGLDPPRPRLQRGVCRPPGRCGGALRGRRAAPKRTALAPATMNTVHPDNAAETKTLQRMPKTVLGRRSEPISSARARGPY